MKKVIILILAALPIVLLILIAFAGRVFDDLNYKPVKQIKFVDLYGTVYTDEKLFVVEQGATRHTKIDMTPSPEEVSNPKVTYSSDDPSICTVDENGVITGVHFGSTTVRATTLDGASAMLSVKVTADKPVGVEFATKGEMDSDLPVPIGDAITLIKGEMRELIALVDAPVAVDKSVSFASDNEDIVRIDEEGKLVAVSVGVATITVRTNTGGLTDSCVITVEDGITDISVDLSSVPGITLENGNWILKSSTVDLKEYIRLSDAYRIEDVTYEIISGKNWISLEDGVVSFNEELALNGYKLVQIRVYVSKDKFTELKLAYQHKG